MTQTRLPALLVAAIALGAIALPSHARAQWWSSREPVDYEDCAARAEKTTEAKQRDKDIAACEARFAGRRKPGGGYTYYDFMQDRSFDIAGPNPTADEQREIDQHYTAFLDQNRRSIIAAAFARKQRELTEAKLAVEPPAPAKSAVKPQSTKPATKSVEAAATASAPPADAPPRPVEMASLTPPQASPAPVRATPIPTPRPSAAAQRAAAAKKRENCQPSLSCGWARFTDGVSNLTSSLFGPPPKKPHRS